MSNSIFGTGNLHWCPLVPMKWQVREWVIRLNIQDLRCDVGMTVYTLVWLWYWKFVLFMERSTRKYSILQESGPILHEGGPTQRMVLKAISKKGFSCFIAARE